MNKDLAILEMMFLSSVCEKMDNKELLWRIGETVIDMGELPIVGIEADLVGELENRLYPEYDGKTVIRTETGWRTPDGDIVYEEIKLPNIP